MLDRTIPFYNIILRCDSYKRREIILPKGFSIVPYKNGYETEWAKLECSIGDFNSLEEAKKYFIKTYLYDKKLLNNILFLLDKYNHVIGSCIAWKDERKKAYVSSLHWLIVDKRYRGLGLGKMLCSAVMNIFEEFPIYIHTQPWSWKAIFLYISLGFKLQRTDTFAQYENEYTDAMKELKKIVTEKQFTLLQESSED